MSLTFKIRKVKMEVFIITSSVDEDSPLHAYSEVWEELIKITSELEKEFGDSFERASPYFTIKIEPTRTFPVVILKFETICASGKRYILTMMYGLWKRDNKFYLDLPPDILYEELKSVVLSLLEIEDDIYD